MPSNEILDCASVVVETVLLGMKTIRAEIRAERPQELSVPQFRMLAYLNRREGASLSDLAEHMELTLPSVSRAVDCLVRRGHVERDASEEDRRRVALALTDDGRKAFHSAKDSVRMRVAELLNMLSEAERAELMRGMEVLRSALPTGKCKR